jgi:arylsulfatase A-like enzyme
MNGKAQPYEEDIRVPLLVSGPGVRAGASLDQFALNIDLAPTIAELTGATPGRVMDGRSLAPLLVRDTPPPHNWRKDFLVEFYRVPGQPGSPGQVLRTRNEVYVEYADGFRELYDLREDPYQLNNIFPVADKGHLKNLSERLAELVASSGESSNGNPHTPGSAAARAGHVRHGAVNPFSALRVEGENGSEDESPALAIIDSVPTGAPVAAR